MKVWSTDGSPPAHGSSISWTANNAAAPSRIIPHTAPRLQTFRNVLPANAARSERERRSQTNSGYIDADERWTRKPIQYGCCNVKIGCQNGNSGPSTNHSSEEVRMAQGKAATASHAGPRQAVHFPSTPKKTSAQDKSAHW